MPDYRFTRGARFHWNGILYEVVRLLLNDRVEFHDLEFEQPQIEERTVLEQAWSDGQLVFAPVHHSMSGTEEQTVYLGLALDDYPRQEIDTAKWRLEVIEPLLEKGKVSQGDIEGRIEEVRKSLTEEEARNPGRRLSVRTIRNWMKRYRNGGEDLRSLIRDVRDRGGDGKRRKEPFVEQTMETTTFELLATDLGASIDTVWAEIVQRIREENMLRSNDSQLTPPSRITVWRRMQAYKSSASMKQPSKKRTSNRNTDRIDQPLAVAEIDHTVVDLIAVDDDGRLPLGRLTFTSVLDVATRYPLGFYMGFEPENYYAVMEALFRAILPKPNVREIYGTEHDWHAKGKPLVLRFDRGKSFNNRHLSDALDMLRIEEDKLPPRTPFFKPFVERYFRTTNDGLFHYMDGTTLSNYVKRGDYDSLQKAALTCFEIEQQLHIYMLDHYAERKHRGIGVPPALRWKELTKPPFNFRFPGNARDLLIALGWVEERVIHDYGIDIGHIRYKGPEIKRLQSVLGGEKAKIKYHPGDLSRIYVFDPSWDAVTSPEDSKPYVAIKAIDQEYTSLLSSWQHKIVLDYQKEINGRIDPSQFAIAKRKMDRIMAEAKDQKQQISVSRRVARFQSVPPSLVRLKNDAEAAGENPAEDEPPFGSGTLGDDDDWELPSEETIGIYHELSDDDNQELLSDGMGHVHDDPHTDDGWKMLVDEAGDEHNDLGDDEDWEIPPGQEDSVHNDLGDDDDWRLSSEETKWGVMYVDRHKDDTDWELENDDK